MSPDPLLSSARFSAGSTSSTAASNRASQVKDSRALPSSLDAQRFQRCLQDTHQRQSSDAESQEPVAPPFMTTDNPNSLESLLSGDLPLAPLSDEDADLQQLLTDANEGHSEEFASGELALFAQAGQPQQSTGDALVAGSPGHTVTVNAAVAAILSEYQQRVRRHEQRSWTFSLEGLFDQPIAIQIDCTADNEWLVQVDTNGLYEEHDTLQLLVQLETRLKEQTNLLRGGL